MRVEKLTCSRKFSEEDDNTGNIGLKSVSGLYSGDGECFVDKREISPTHEIWHSADGKTITIELPFMWTAYSVQVGRCRLTS